MFRRKKQIQFRIVRAYRIELDWICVELQYTTTKDVKSFYFPTIAAIQRKLGRAIADEVERIFEVAFAE